MSKKTVVIQIGNSDDKLTQKEWSQFVRDIGRLVHGYGIVHFSGSSDACAPWQNACWVLEMSSMDDLRSKLIEIKNDYRQDSIAITIGDTEIA